MNKKMKRLLIASLVCNVLLAGAIAGHTVKRNHHGHHRSDRIMEAILQALPDEKRPLARLELEKARAESRKSWQEMRNTREAMLSALGGEEFNVENYDLQANKLAGIKQQMMTPWAKATRTIALSLSREERKSLAEALKRKSERGVR